MTGADVRSPSHDRSHAARTRPWSTIRLWTAISVIAGLSCAATLQAQDSRTKKRLEAVRAIVAAVNARDADAYVANFADAVAVRLYEGEVRIRGREAVRQNRLQHFERYPHVRNELLHLVAINDRVILHDRVWLDQRSSQPADVVEVYTFDGDDRIVLVDVIQPHDAFTRGSRPR